MYMNTEMLRFTLEKYDKYTFMFLPGQFSVRFPLTNVFGHYDYGPVSELNMIGLHW